MHSGKEVSLTCVIAATLWTLGVFLILAEVIIDLGPNDGRIWSAIGKLGLVMCMGGATLTVKGYAVRAVKIVRSDIAEEQSAFDLGVDYGRAQGDVRSLR